MRYANQGLMILRPNGTGNAGGGVFVLIVGGGIKEIGDGESV
jgi:hypothetical protein